MADEGYRVLPFLLCRLARTVPRWREIPGALNIRGPRGQTCAAAEFRTTGSHPCIVIVQELLSNRDTFYC